MFWHYFTSDCKEMLCNQIFSAGLTPSSYFTMLSICTLQISSHQPHFLRGSLTFGSQKTRDHRRAAAPPPLASLAVYLPSNRSIGELVQDRGSVGSEAGLCSRVPTLLRTWLMLYLCKLKRADLCASNLT